MYGPHTPGSIDDDPEHATGEHFTVAHSDSITTRLDR